MRQEHYLRASTRRLSLRARLADLVCRLMPQGAFRRMMESQFINFGLETTNICNANCTFCGYRFMERPKTVMPWEVFERAVNEFVAHGGGSINFTPTVGDPLVDKRIVEKLEFVGSKPEISSVMLYTNAILLSRFDLKRILTSGLTRLAMSTYVGSREGYLHYYGKDKYDQVIGNMIAVASLNQKLGKPVRITLHLRADREEANWRETEAFQTLAGLIGEENMTFLYSYDSWSGRIAPEDLPKGCDMETPLSVEEKKASPCFELYRRMHILADGNVGACICTDIESEIKIGNVYESSLEEIWNGQKLKEYRSNWTQGKIPDCCVSCTRYMGLDEFIAGNRKRILTDYLRRKAPGLVRPPPRTVIDEHDEPETPLVEAGSDGKRPANPR